MFITTITQIAYFIEEYQKIIIFFFVTTLISTVLSLIAILVSSKIIPSDALSEYECGFDPFDDATRQPFDVHYYIVGILFLIFDIEIVAIFPWVLNIKTYGLFGYWTMILFLFLLTVGFLYEWFLGALKWPRVNLTPTPTPSLFSSKKNYLLTSLLSTSPSLSNFTSDYAYFSTLYIFLTMYFEIILLVLLSLGLLFIIFLKKTPSAFDKVESYSALVPQGLLTYQANPQIRFASSKFLPTWYLYQFRINPNVLLVKYFLSFSFLFLIILNIFLLAAELNSWFSLISIQYFYFNYFNFSFIFNYFWIDFFYLICSTALVFIILWLVQLSVNNTNLFLKSNLIEFYFFILSSLFFFVITIKSVNLISIFLGIIGFSINSYLLIMSSSTAGVLSKEAALKYYYLSVLSSMLIAAGIFIVFSKFGTTNFSKISCALYYLNEAFSSEVNLTLATALFLIIFGFLFKLNCFPCHWWSADVYNGLSYPILLFFILPIKLTVYVALTNILLNPFYSMFHVWQPLIIFSSYGSMLWGAFFTLTETKIKKFLALSSINQLGFVLLSLSDNTTFSLYSGFFYIGIYLLTNIILLTILVSTFDERVDRNKNISHTVDNAISLLKHDLFYISKNAVQTSQTLAYKLKSTTVSDNLNNLNFKTSLFHELKYIVDIKNFSTYNWKLSFYILIVFFSMAGIPPLAGFFAKLYVLTWAMSLNQLFIIIVALGTSVLSTYYYMRFIKILMFETKITILHSIKKYLFLKNYTKTINTVFVCYLSFCHQILLDAVSIVLVAVVFFNTSYFLPSVISDFGLSLIVL